MGSVMPCGPRRYGAASVRVKVPGALPVHLRSHYRELTRFRSEVPGCGDGTRLLERLCGEADATRMGLLLLADNDRLANWYARHGFAPLPGKARLMARKPA